jgi:hypothetical protein
MCGVVGGCADRESSIIRRLSFSEAKRKKSPPRRLPGGPLKSGGHHEADRVLSVSIRCAESELEVAIVAAIEAAGVEFTKRQAVRPSC